MNRRELLKLSPLLALGAFAIPRLRDPLLTAGVGFTDWASAKWFRRDQLAPTFADSELTPLDKFYVNTYDVDDPEVDLEKWTLTVSGDVKRPGEYTLAQIQSLPKLTQNTRHICVEGWDVIGRFGGARISDFLQNVGANLNSKFLYVGMCRRLLRIARHGFRSASAISAVLRDVRPPAHARARRTSAAARSHEDRL